MSLAHDCTLLSSTMAISIIKHSSQSQRVRKRTENQTIDAPRRARKLLCNTMNIPNSRTKLVNVINIAQRTYCPSRLSASHLGSHGICCYIFWSPFTLKQWLDDREWWEGLSGQKARKDMNSFFIQQRSEEELAYHDLFNEIETHS